jgi:hypothetical protein
MCGIKYNQIRSKGTGRIVTMPLRDARTRIPQNGTSILNRIRRQEEPVRGSTHPQTTRRHIPQYTSDVRKLGLHIL